MYRRFIETRIGAALADTRVVLLNGARQTGKSTLAQALAAQRGGQYLTLDDPVVAGTARSDAAALIAGAGDFLVIDEVQHAPALFPALKRSVDRDRTPGRFLLTGSANVLLLPRISESLAGRMEILSLEPLAQAEIGGAEANFVDWLFARPPWRVARFDLARQDVCRRIVAGGFPEAVAREDGDRRNAWFRSYITSLLQRDIRDLANIEGLTELPRLLTLLAARATGLMNMAELARACAQPHTTIRRYLALLEATFVFCPLPAWSANLSKRLVKSPKAHLIDSGLTAYLRGESDAGVLARAPAIGPLLETFVHQELRKQNGWRAEPVGLHHYRTATGQEVDFVLEDLGGRIVGVEVKAAVTLAPADIAGLRALGDAAGARFVRGVVLYLGEQCVPLADRIWAVPVSALWQSPAAGAATGAETRKLPRRNPGERGRAQVRRRR